MSNQELDKLFKNKLEDFSKSPSGDLWGEIDAQLSKKNKKPAIWNWSVAASILLLMFAGVFFYLQPSQDQDNVLAVRDNTSNVTIKRSNQKPSTSEDTREEIPLQEESKNTEPTIPQNNLIKQKSIPSPSKSENKNDIEEPAEEVDELKKIEADSTIEKIELEKDIMPIELQTDVLKNIALNEAPEATIEEAVASNDTKGKTMVFDISQFNKEPALSEEKKETKLKKLFKIAKDIKQGESGLGELRAAKNDLFAFNSKKEENGR